MFQLMTDNELVTDVPSSIKYLRTPRAAAASALCVRRRPARPVPKLTSLASGRGRTR